MVDYRQFEVDIEDLGRHSFGGLEPPGSPSSDGKIKIGVCAMRKKAKSKPMREIINRLSADRFDVEFFDEEVILNEPIEMWPRCHALVAFFSDGYPLEKVERYAVLRKPFLVNELKHQHLLKDRRHVLKILQKYGVPFPEHVVVNRSSDSPSGFPVEITNEQDFQEFDDHIVVKGKVMKKPFVEKPVDGDDHNIYIYYPRSAGGGSCRLFRKVKDRSSEFFPDENNVRRNGSFIYESFLRTEGSDVKVYTVGPNYAHSEARKSPTIDGVVSRNENGYEVRFPVLLTAYEKEISNTIVSAFGQRICGFDVLRSDSRSYICDVNGWSFVKNNYKYYDDFALVLDDLLRRAMGIATEDTVFLEEEGSLSNDEHEESEDTGDDVTGGTTSPNAANSAHLASRRSSVKILDQPKSHEELRCVIAVVRHGDRTPKQKLKIKVDQPKVLALFDTYGVRTQRDELKLKNAGELGAVLSIIQGFIEAIEAARRISDDEDSDDSDDSYGQLLQARSVLEMHGTFKGINRKVQLKPTEWDPDTGAISAAQFILKWGGVLTQQGRQQAELMGTSFRHRLYPFDGLLRLHSTYRHDLKIYSSNEGRVQVTAAAFAKGMLQLEGHLTPILASLVRKSEEVDSLLDAAHDAKNYINDVKARLHDELLSENSSKESILSALAATEAPSIVKALDALDYKPREGMKLLHSHICILVKQLRICVRTQRARYGTNPGAEGKNVGIANPSALIGSGGAVVKGEEILSPVSATPSPTNIFAEDGRQQQQQPPPPPRGEPNSAGSAKSSPESSTMKDSDGGSVLASLGRGIDVSTQKLMRQEQLQKIVTENNQTDLLMSLYRWTKLEKDFYNKKKDRFDLSKIPDIHDSVRYDLLHNPGLGKLKPASLQSIYELAHYLADVIVPQEYGITPVEKKNIGSRISRSLVAKIQSDLHNTITGFVRSSPPALAPGDPDGAAGKSSLPRDGSVANLHSSGRPYANVATPPLPSATVHEHAPAGQSARGLTRETSTATLASNSEVGTGGEGQAAETLHRLDKRHARRMGIKSSDRLVRTRLYFTSESHLHSLLNILRYAAAETVNARPDEIEIPPLSQETLEKLGNVEELNYLTHVVFRLYEIIPDKRRGGNKTTRRKTSPRESSRNQEQTGSSSSSATLNSESSEPCPARFRISIYVSPGVEMNKDEHGDYHQGQFSSLEEAANANKNYLRACKTAQGTESKSDIQLPPCTEMIPVFDDIEYSKIDGLLTHVLNNVADDLEHEFAQHEGEFVSSPPSPSASPAIF